MYSFSKKLKSYLFTVTKAFKVVSPCRDLGNFLSKFTFEQYSICTGLLSYIDVKTLSFLLEI